MSLAKENRVSPFQRIEQSVDLQNRKSVTHASQIPYGYYQEATPERNNPSPFVEQLFLQQTKQLIKEVKELQQVIQDQKNDYNIICDKIYSIPSNEWQLISPINILIKFSQDEVIAIIPDLELYSDGRNEIEAVSNLKLELLDLINDLDEIPEAQLGRDPRGWKKSLNMLIKKCQ